MLYFACILISEPICLIWSFSLSIPLSSENLVVVVELKKPWLLRLQPPHQARSSPSQQNYAFKSTNTSSKTRSPETILIYSPDTVDTTLGSHHQSPTLALSSATKLYLSTSTLQTLSTIYVPLWMKEWTVFWKFFNGFETTTSCWGD